MAKKKKPTEQKEKPARQPAEAAFVGMPKKITQLLDKESDRGGILILAAYLEELLGLIVRAACVSDETADSILELHKPAGDFESKILLCTALALIHPDEAKALKNVQKIRNRAAHFDRKGGRGFDVLFDSPQTIDQVIEFHKALGLTHKSRDVESIRVVFNLSGRLLATRLWMRLYETKRPEPALSRREIANQIRDYLKDTPLGQQLLKAEKESRESGLEMQLELFQGFANALDEMLKQKLEPGGTTPSAEKDS